MKMNEIKVGAKYAVGSKWQQEPSRVDGTRGCYEATVLEVRLHRLVWDGWHQHKSQRADGVKVRYVHSGEEKVIPQQEVCQEWDAYVAQDAETARSYRERARARANAHKDVSARLASLQEVLADYDVKLPWWADGRVYNDGSFATKGEVTATELANLLETAFAAGREAKA
jgi:hypothetical protein